MNGWQVFGVVADFVGVFSFIVGGITSFNTFRIKKNLLKHTEKSDYQQDIDAQINEIQSFCDTLKKDQSLYTVELLDLIMEQLSDIEILYETIMPRKIMNDISKLKVHIRKKCYTNLNDEKAKRECRQQLHNINTKLRKEKKVQ